MALFDEAIITYDASTENFFPGDIMKNTDLQARKNAATPRGVGVMCDFYAARAQNSELWDVEGRRFIDFASGIAVLNTGHRHPKLVTAMQAQLEKFTHTAYQIVPYESYVALAERIIGDKLFRTLHRDTHILECIGGEDPGHDLTHFRHVVGAGDWYIGECLASFPITGLVAQAQLHCGN